MADLSAIETQLKQLGELPDHAIPVVKTLSLMGHYERPIVDLALYERHIDALHQALAAEIQMHPLNDAENILTYRLNRLNDVLRHQFSYAQDDDEFGAIDTINLLTVIDRRKGIPVALGALYIELAAKQNWPIYGLNFPGHFLLRLDEGSQRLIFDPYHGGKEMNAGSMRQLLKATVGPEAELDHAYYETVTSRDIILRFYNNKKTRLITDARYHEALAVTEQMLWVAPNEARLYFDDGILSAKVGHFKNALDYLGKFINLSTDKRSIAEARDMIADLSRRLQ